MPQKPYKPQAAAELLRALEAPDTMACADARALLPDLAEAEAAGADADGMPRFAALLRHLDRCAECMASYVQLAEDLAGELADAAPAPLPMPAAPRFFAPARQSAGVTLQLLGGLRRAFQLDLRVALPQPGTLSGGQQISLFADTLAELGGAPLVSVALTPATADTPATLLVAVRDIDAATRWEVQASVASTVRTAITDERGIAQIDALPLADAALLELACRELP